MNDTPIGAELAQNQFATAVRNFTPKPSAKFQKLLPLKDGIVELRHKGASYVIIADILPTLTMRGASVGVCVGTLTDWHRHCVITSAANQ